MPGADSVVGRLAPFAVDFIRRAVLGLALCTGAVAPAHGEPALASVEFAAQLLTGPQGVGAVEPQDHHFEPQPWAGGLGQGVARALLTAYRQTLARSDLDLCAFAPSCSRFAQLALERAGAVRGVLLAADRLLRDGPGAATHGLRLTVDGRRRFDPVEDYLQSEASCHSCAGR